MGGIMSDLTELGLGELQEEKLYETEEDIKVRQRARLASKAPKIEEKEIVYDRIFACPVCGLNFASKVMKTGKTKFLSSDLDLRPKYEGIDSGKYDALVCDHCGNGMLSKFFGPIPSTQAKLIQEKITLNLKCKVYRDDTYSYEQALDRYRVTLACALVRKAKNSEKAYICLKMAWLYRGQREYLEEKRQLLPKTRQELEAKEKEYLESAVEGFVLARSKETFPICGMDVSTFDYLIAAVAYEAGNLELAGRLAADLLVKKGINTRIKDKARNLKDLIVQAKEKKADS